MSQITCTALTKRYGTNAAAVDAIDLRVDDGEVLALLGPSGCGKTTTLAMLAGFLQPDAGEILIDGKLVSSATKMVPPERRGASLVFQSYAVWPHLSVFDNVAFGLRLRKLGRGEIEKRVGASLDIVQLSKLAQRFPSELSGGQQQRVALARAIAVEPKILLLDEPLSNLDARLREEMRFEVRQIHERTGMTTVYVTHDQSEAMVIADRIALLNAGRIEQIGRAEDIYERPSTSWAAGFVGKTNALPATGIDARSVRLGTVALAADGAATLAPGVAGFVCIRPERIGMSAANGTGAVAGNALRGRVVRQTYLGDTRDYVVAIDGTDLRVRAVTAGHLGFAPGADVDLTIPREAAHVVAR